MNVIREVWRAMRNNTPMGYLSGPAQRVFAFMCSAPVVAMVGLLIYVLTHKAAA